MSKFQFLNKRDKQGLLLAYSMTEFSYNLADTCLAKIKNYETYKQLINFLPKKYIDMYFKKLFCEALIPLSAQTVINKWHLENDGKLISKKVEATGFPSEELLRLVWPESDFDFKIVNNLQTYKINIKDKIWPYYNNWLKFKNYFNNKNFLISKSKNTNNFKLKKNNIAVNYVEGHNIENRNDLFWLKQSAVDPSSVVVYFDNKRKMERFSNNVELLSSLKNYGVHPVKLWEWHGIKNIDFTENLLRQINKNKPKDLIEKWLIKNSRTLISKIEFWFSFFQDYNIKIHFNSDELGLTNIIRQIAITKLDGCSIGKIRSYPNATHGDSFGYYPNNSFFVWGADSAKRIQATENGIDNVVISGFPYQDKTTEQKNKIEKIKNNLKSKGVKFSFMLLDTGHSKNDNHMWQLVDTKEMIKFYESFFKWFNEDKEIGIIVKSKYPVILKNLPHISKLIQSAVKTGRCYLTDTFGEISKNYASIVDFSISISAYYPGVLIQNILAGTRGVFYDHANLENLEKDIYSWGRNKVFFTDLDEMVKKLKAYKESSANNREIGDWSKEIDGHDPFRDAKGPKRIGLYVDWLQRGFDMGLKKEDCLTQANKMYAKNWGEDKINYAK